MKREEYKTISKRAKALLLKAEGFDVEFKVSLSGLDAQDIAAFPNSDSGGAILIGIDEIKDASGRQKGIVKGCAIGDREKLAIINKAESCTPPINVEIYIENSGKAPFYRVEIPSGENKPYCTAGGTYKIRGDGRTKALTPSRLLSMFLKSETQEFVERFKEATSELELSLSDTKAKLISEISSLLPIVQDMEGKIEYSLNDIFGSAQSAEANAEEANAFSDETLHNVQLLQGRIEEIEDYTLTDISRKVDALLDHFGLEDPRVKTARLKVEQETIEKFEAGLSDDEILDFLAECWKNGQFYAAYNEVCSWCTAMIKSLHAQSETE